MNCHWIAVGAISLALLPHLAQAQVTLGPRGPEPVDTEKQRGLQRKPAPRTFVLTIDPAAEPVPPLKYSLVIDYLDQTPGNAAPYYYRALLQFKDNFSGGYSAIVDEKYNAWMEMPPADLPREDVSQVLNGFSGAFAQLKIAASRETCDWDWRLRELKGIETITFTFPEFHECRTLARLVALKARLEIVDGRYEDAIDTLRIGYRLARDVARPPTMINLLTGVGLTSLMDEQLLALIAAPDSPNMYWAIAELPTPFIEKSAAVRHEMAIPEMMFPFLRDAETEQRTPDEWRTVMYDAFIELRDFGVMLDAFTELRDLTGYLNDPEMADIIFTALMLKGYPAAKQELLQMGFTSEQLDAMPVAQVMAIQQARTYHYVYEQVFKWSLLPYREAMIGFRDQFKRLKDQGYLRPATSEKEALPIAWSLLPAVDAAMRAVARPDIRHAGMRVLEAIRMYAAQHGNGLPQTLAEIKDLPLPENESTGESFSYFYDARNASAVLEVRDPFGVTAADWRIEITIRQ